MYKPNYEQDIFKNFADFKDLTITFIRHASLIFQFGDNFDWQNERELFIAEVTKIAASGLGFVEPLYYRRALNKSEVSNFWKSIEGKWGANRSYWYPLNEKTHPSLIALGISDLDQVVVQKRIQSFLKTRNVDRVIELRKFGTLLSW